MPKKIYIDMDGTLCRFHDTEHKYVEAMWEQGFYLNLKPFENFLNGLSVCIDRNPDTEFYILSAVLDTEPPFAEDEKRKWLHKYLPQLSDEQMIFTPAGADKSKYIGKINSDCCLIDDYNVNLNKWQSSGGTAIKFINDINNRGLGAYGGEKGALWNGLSIEHNQSSMDICLQIEQYAGIVRTGEKANARYGFDGDVLPWDFSSNIIPYFEIRNQMNYERVHQLSLKGETFENYITVKKDNYDLSEQPQVKDYMNRHNADEALIRCLEKCYALCQLHEISADKISSWVAASIKFDNTWKTYPVTLSNVQMYITSMLDRDAYFKELSEKIESKAISLKKFERQLYLPGSTEVIDDYLSNGEKLQHTKDTCTALKNDLNALKSEWKQFAKTDYPYIAYGNSKCKYALYSKKSPIVKPK